jgi:hypothetical protein
MGSYYCRFWDLLACPQDLSEIGKMFNTPSEDCGREKKLAPALSLNQV